MGPIYPLMGPVYSLLFQHLNLFPPCAPLKSKYKVEDHRIQSLFSWVICKPLMKTIANFQFSAFLPTLFMVLATLFMP